MGRTLLSRLRAKGHRDAATRRFAELADRAMCLRDMMLVMGASDSGMLRGGADQRAVEEKIAYQNESARKELANAWDLAAKLRRRGELRARLAADLERGRGRPAGGGTQCHTKSPRQCARAQRKCALVAVGGTGGAGYGAVPRP